MDIELQNIGKRFQFEWVFRKINTTIYSGEKVVVLGPNGSGKSTLLKTISGFLLPSEGKINYAIENKPIVDQVLFSKVSMASPYIELIEELTLDELIGFHFKFKPLRSDLSLEKVKEIINLKNIKNKQIKFFSSGMKQRVKLGLAFCSDTPLLILDEPTSNLDLQGVEWYLSLIQDYSANRTTIIGSNDEREYEFCTQKINIINFKHKKKLK